MEIDLITRREADPSRVAVILPGAGYFPALPLLHYTGRVLNELGWTIHEVWWDVRTMSDSDDRQSWVCDQAVRAIEAEPQAERVLLVGKSLGSLALRLAAERQLPGVWLTPLLTEPTVRQALQAIEAPTLLVGGTGDRVWDSDFAQACGHTVHEVPGADHAMEVSAGIGDSARVHADVADAVDAFARKLG
ncbi:alpha/beta hydrolase [Flindersiella endophytica]